MEARDRAGNADDHASRLDAAMVVLASHGYEPSRSGARIRLRRMVSALDLPNGKAALDPQPGMCCVAVELGADRALQASAPPSSGT
jgi:hypothetical protein